MAQLSLAERQEAALRRAERALARRNRLRDQLTTAQERWEVALRKVRDLDVPAQPTWQRLGISRQTLYRIAPGPWVENNLDRWGLTSETGGANMVPEGEHEGGQDAEAVPSG